MYFTFQTEKWWEEETRLLLNNLKHLDVNMFVCVDDTAPNLNYNLCKKVFDRIKDRGCIGVQTPLNSDVGNWEWRHSRVSMLQKKLGNRICFGSW